MRCFIWSWVSVFALLVLPFAGCSGSTTEGAAGAGGDAGAGGSAGAGGMAGTGGTEAVSSGFWTGSGPGGADGAYTICFNVRGDGEALVRGADPNQVCDGWSIAVRFPDCEGVFQTNEVIPIVAGAFHLVIEDFSVDISGTLDGATASGEATVGAFPDGTCSGSWEATPSP